MTEQGTFVRVGAPITACNSLHHGHATGKLVRLCALRIAGPTLSHATVQHSLSPLFPCASLDMQILLTLALAY